MTINLERLKEELKRDEGFRARVYDCSAGKKTVGYGHNLEDADMPKDVAEKLLEHDMLTAMVKCEHWDWFYGLSDTRQRVIVNMVFNMGANGVTKFVNMINCIRLKDYMGAAAEMENSRWYRQVGNRATRLVTMMETDVAID